MEFSFRAHLYILLFSKPAKTFYHTHKKYGCSCPYGEKIILRLLIKKGSDYEFVFYVVFHFGACSYIQE